MLQYVSVISVLLHFWLFGGNITNSDLIMLKRKISVQTSDAVKKPKLSNHWSMGLLQTMNDPNNIVTSDDLVTVIKDVYPKAECHYLILPKEDISSLKALKKDHINLLKHMHKVGENLVKDVHPKKVFKMGYHSQPSMTRLHMHVISDDMNSKCLKTKKHWNSFCTTFFLDSKEVISNLEKNGEVILPDEKSCKKLLEAPLKCHKCDYMPKHMPDLKHHILEHCK